MGLGRNTNCSLPTLLNGQEQKESLLSVTYLSEKQKEKNWAKKAEPNGLGLRLTTNKEVHFAFNTHFPDGGFTYQLRIVQGFLETSDELLCMRVCPYNDIDLFSSIYA